MNAVITGGTKGIGKAIAELFLSKGINVAMCSRTSADIDKFIKEAKEKYPQATVIGMAADMSKKKRCLLLLNF